MECTIWPMISRVRSVRWRASPAMMPARKNPNSAVRPTHWVSAPHASPRQHTNVSTAPGFSVMRVPMRATARSTRRKPKVSENAVKANVKTSRNAIDPRFTAALVATASTRLNTIQARMSLTA